MPVEIVEKELSYKVVQAAYEVFNGLGPGFLEKIYQEAMVLVLRKNRHSVEVQKSVPVIFLGKQIGVHVLDIVVDGRIILELKAVSEIAPIHKQQALSTLKASGLSLAMIIDFGAHRLQVTRVVHTKQKEKTA